MSKKAIKDCVTFFDNRLWNWTNCEIAFGKAFQPFYDSLYTSSPRLCIQDWYKHIDKSKIQSDDHIIH